MRIDVITIFPDYLSPLHESLIGQAVSSGIVDLAVHDLRDYTTDRHRTVDDTPYGGGPGMVMRPDIWGRALDDVTATRQADDTDTESDSPILVVPTPSGAPFTQEVAQQLALAPHLVFGCGRYEGIDARVMSVASRTMRVCELSIGDYVLAGGEVASLVMIEAIGRLLPGVLGNAESVADDSFTANHGLLEGPVYTRPSEYRGLSVPDELLSGHHAKITRFRRDQALRRTARFRPELLTQLGAQDCDGDDLEVLLDLGVSAPAGLAERVEDEQAMRAAKKAKNKRRKRRLADGR